MAYNRDFNQVIRHLQRLKRALEPDVVARVDAPGGRHAALKVDGLPGDVTCRPNEGDAGHPWYFHNGEPVAAAWDVAQAREAAAKLRELRVAAGAR